MGYRLVATVLALVLFWSGVGTIEGLPGGPQPFSEQPSALASSSGTEEGQNGSVEDHHLDDMPVQPVSEPPLDSPGLPGVEPLLRLARDAAPRRPATASVLRAPPCLAGPLRPPCGTTRLA